MSRKWLGVGLILLVLIAYIPALRAGFVWDDDRYVTENPTLRTLDGLRRIWFELGAVPQYYPLVHTTFWIEYHLWQLSPLGYHLDNILLHALNAILLWILLRRLSVPGAWVAAAIFALHPVHVESVAWITERKNVLSGFFYLSALLAYLRFFGLGDAPENKSEGQGGFYLLAFILFTCALLSKTITCFLPGVILLLLWWQRGRLRWREVYKLIPLFALGAGLGLLTVWMEKYRVGALGEEWTLSFIDRTLIAGRALWFYAGKLLWPHQLTFIYPRWQIDSGIWWQCLFPLAAVAVIVALWLLRRRMGKAPLVAVLYFVGMLIPALGFFAVYPMQYSFVADHFQYLASIGLIGLGVAAITTYFKRVGLLKKPIIYIACTTLLLILGVLTWRQGHIYKDLETLWRDTLTKNPSAWIAHHNLANVLVGQGKIEEAVVHYREALYIKPDSAKHHCNLANVLVRQGKIEEAAVHCRETLRIQPDYTQAHCNLGNILLRQGKIEEAITHYREALRIRPRYIEAHYNLGVAFSIAQDKDSALQEYRILKNLDEYWANRLFDLINK